MTFEVDTNQNQKPGNQDSQHNERQASEYEVSNADLVLALRARQAALDVVLDGCSLMRAQSRLMSVVDKMNWEQAFVICRQEVEKLRAQLAEGASFEDVVMAAEDAGEDIQSLAERLNVSVEQIADILDNRGTVKI